MLASSSRLQKLADVSAIPRPHAEHAFLKVTVTMTVILCMVPRLACLQGYSYYDCSFGKGA